MLQVRVAFFSDHFCLKNDHSTKTGSGQTEGKHSKRGRRPVFLLQVGRLGCSSRTSGCPVPPQYEAWTRAHFAAFCIVSSPLVLSILPSDENLAPLLDIIGNKQAMVRRRRHASHVLIILRCAYT
jgi:hypothetical protein